MRLSLSRAVRALRTATTAALIVGASPSIARAADPPPQDIAQARDLGQQALTAFEGGNFTESEKLWLAASKLYPAAPTLTLGLARAQAKLGKLVLAQESYNKIIREESQNTNGPPAFKGALESAKTEVGAVSAKIASVVIHVEGGAPNPNVKIDGQPISSAGLGLRRPVDPGSHTVKADAPGYTSAETTFEVAESGAADATIKLEKAQDVPGQPAVADPPLAHSTPKGSGSNKTLAVAALGVGGAGLIFGGVTGLLAVGKHSDLSDKCPNDVCPASAQSDVDSYKTMGTLSTIGFVVGGVGIAVGAVLWFTSPKETVSAANPARITSRSSWSVVPYVGASGGGFTGRF